MINKKRLILYIVSFILLVITTTLIILFCKGYRFNFQNKKFVKLGMIAIKSIPREANVYINDNYKKSKSPFNFSTLPGKYGVKIQKDGFITWQRQINVETGLVNHLDYAFLIYNNRPLNSITTDGINNFLISPSYEKVAFVDLNNNVWIADVKTNEQKKIYSGTKQNQSIEINDWDKNNNNLLITEKIGKEQSLRTVSLDEETLLRNIPGKIKKIEFVSNADDKVFVLSGSNLYSLDRNGYSIGENGILDFSQNRKSIFFIKDTGAEKEIWKSDLDLSSKNKLQTEKSNNIALFPGPKDRLVYTAGDDNELFYLENESKVKINKNVLDVQWTKNEKKLNYRKTEEIYVYTFESDDPREPKNRITTRLSNPIDKSYWFYDSKHILYRVGAEINLIEIDGYNLVNLTNKAALSNVFITNKYGRSLIFAEEKNGLVNIKIMKLSEPEGLIPY